MDTTQAIGVYDSGSGGLTVWRSITSLLPHESIVYLGDHAYSPYGEKTKICIRKRAHASIQFLLSQKVKMIVIACNTATTAGIDLYRKQFPEIPIIGVVPVIKTAQSLTKTNSFAVLSTSSTAKSAYQKNLIRIFASRCTVFSLGNSQLVAMIEEGKKDTNEVRSLLERILKPLAKKNIDVLVLGCTHFPFLRFVIQDILGPGVAVLDSGDAVARHVKHILEQEQGLSDAGKQPVYSFFTTGDVKKVSAVASDLLGMAIVVQKASGYAYPSY